MSYKTMNCREQIAQCRDITTALKVPFTGEASDVTEIALEGDAIKKDTNGIVSTYTVDAVKENKKASPTKAPYSPADFERAVQIIIKSSGE